MKEKGDILLIATGGTIAAEPYEQTPKDVTVRNNYRVMGELPGMAPNQWVRVVDFAIKDSKHLTPMDIAAMARTISEAKEAKVLITHGTDAMAPNARALLAVLKEHYPDALKKTVIFTGAMQPLAHGPEASDGYANLRDSVARLNSEALQGVWMMMGGEILDPERTDKDMAQGRFVQR